MANRFIETKTKKKQSEEEKSEKDYGEKIAKILISCETLIVKDVNLQVCIKQKVKLSCGLKCAPNHRHVHFCFLFLFLFVIFIWGETFANNSPGYYCLIP